MVSNLVRPVHPILIRNQHGPLLRIAIDVAQGQTAQLTSLEFCLDGTDDLNDIDAVQLFATGNQEAFSPATPIGVAVAPARAITLPIIDLLEPTRCHASRDIWQREVSKEGAEYLEQRRQSSPFGAEGFDLAGLRAGMGARQEPTVPGTILSKVQVGDIPCEWVMTPGADADVRLLYLHGGGWVSGTGGNYLPLAADISLAAQCAVLLPDYRLAPEHPFPAGLEDCVAAHDWLVANGPSGPGAARATFIAGDSAGGNLTLATLLALKQQGRPLPAGAIAISPGTDFTLSSRSLKSVHDPIISWRTMPEFRDRYLGMTDPRNPLASPVFGDFRGLPPLLIQTGEHEMLRDDSIRVAKKARADGVPVSLEIWPGMVHVFQIRGLPESREAIRRIGDFMKSKLGPK